MWSFLLYLLIGRYGGLIQPCKARFLPIHQSAILNEDCSSLATPPNENICQQHFQCVQSTHPYKFQPQFWYMWINNLWCSAQKESFYCTLKYLQERKTNCFRQDPSPVFWWTPQAENSPPFTLWIVFCDQFVTLLHSSF